MHRQAVESGIPLNRCQLIRPGVEFALVKGRRDPNLRRALGFADGDRVIFCPGESTPAAAHYLAPWVASILNFLEPGWKLLLWGRGKQLGKVERFSELTHGPGMLTVAQKVLRRPLAMEAVLPAADMVLITAGAPVPTLPISICMAAALPIVATITPTVAELLEDRHTALFSPSPAARLLAGRLLDLAHDPRLQWSLADMARTEAYEYFSLTRFLDQYRALYRQFAARQRIDLPTPPPGAGARFHGLA
jgi:glycosyltransferase involved in cell wall biosynthesis